MYSNLIINYKYTHGMHVTTINTKGGKCGNEDVSILTFMHERSPFLSSADPSVRYTRSDYRRADKAMERRPVLLPSRCDDCLVASRCSLAATWERSSATRRLLPARSTRTGRGPERSIASTFGCHAAHLITVG